MGDIIKVGIIMTSSIHIRLRLIGSPNFTTHEYVDPIFNVGTYDSEVIHLSVIVHPDCYDSAWIKKINGMYYPHKEDGPAIIDYILKKNRIGFFIEGIGCRIEDLPCDDETKVILKLKYGDCDKNGVYYHQL